MEFWLKRGARVRIINSDINMEKWKITKNWKLFQLVKNFKVFECKLRFRNCVIEEKELRGIHLARLPSSTWNLANGTVNPILTISWDWLYKSLPSVSTTMIKYAQLYIRNMILVKFLEFLSSTFHDGTLRQQTSKRTKFKMLLSWAQNQLIN